MKGLAYIVDSDTAANMARAYDLEKRLSSLGLDYNRKDISVGDNGIPLIEGSLHDLLSGIPRERLASAGLFWKTTGTYASFILELGDNRPCLQFEALRADTINKILPYNSPRVYALTRATTGRMGYLVEFIGGYKLSELFNAEIEPDSMDFIVRGADGQKTIRVTREEVPILKDRLSHAVESLHKGAVLHGDLWPPNVLVSEQGDIPKLIDPWWTGAHETNKCVRDDERSLEFMGKQFDELLKRTR